MKITGEEIEAGVRNWLKKEIVDGPSRELDLGKFFFSVSAGTIGVIFTAEKLTNTPQWDLPLITAFLFLLSSLVLALTMVVPKDWSVEEDTDLFEKRHRIIKRIERSTYIWFSAWLIGTGLGVYAALS